MHSLLGLLLLPLSVTAASQLPPELNTFLGKPPANYQKKYLGPAKDLRKAIDAHAAGKRDQAIKLLLPLSAHGEMTEHAGYELVRLYQEKKDFAKSTALANRLIYELPSSPYREFLDDAVDENDCDLGLQDAKTKSKQAAATELLFRCLQKTRWKEWSDKEDEAEALYGILKSTNDSLFGPFVTELIQALPSASSLRVRLRKELPDADLNKYASVARFRTKNDTPAGVPAVYPDADLFDKGMQAVLESRWSDARGIFREVKDNFPLSAHLDRAQYWSGRAEEALGHDDEAKKIYTAIFEENPLTYYGLQSGLRLKRDLSQFIVPAEEPEDPAKFKGSLMPRQAIALLRLRALLENGLIDPARMEAKSLFTFRPGGFTLGQDNADGAAMMGLLYHTAGYSLAAFSQAYAAISLDPKQLNSATLEMIFPSFFQKQFAAAAEASGVHPLLLDSVTKQESAFIPNATSRANALGLMQVLLSTVRDIDPKLRREQLFEPAINTEMGAKFLQGLLVRYQGNIALALAAYNAGPTRATAWQKRMLEFEGMRKNFDVDTFIDTIPFTETRRYVGSILRNYAWYKLLNKDGTLTSVEELAFQWQNPSKQNQSKKNPSPPSPVILNPGNPSTSKQSPSTPSPSSEELQPPVVTTTPNP